MKNIILILVLLISSPRLLAQIQKIDHLKSSISWTGKKVTGEHHGSIKFVEGFLIFKKNKLKGGTFLADMSSLSNTDQTGAGKVKLENHLKSADFFDTPTYKTAKLEFVTVVETNLNQYAVNANLTIKGRKNPVKFNLILEANTAKAHLVVDRTKYGIQYGSGSFFDDLGDLTIYDEFELEVVLVF
jgi:polyisoprenoid-binding protein YceI